MVHLNRHRTRPVEKMGDIGDRLETFPGRSFCATRTIGVIFCRETISSHRRHILIPLFNNMHHCERRYAFLQQDTVTFHTANNSTPSLEKVFGDNKQGIVTSMFVRSEPV